VPAEKAPDAVSPSRLEAVKSLYVLEKGAKISEVFEKAKYLIPEDAALYREMVYGCTRQKRLLDYQLAKLCTSPFDKLPIEVKICLRLGLYQLMFLDRVPAFAAVHESVNLAKQGGQEALSGFVNAVLRNAEQKKAEFVIKGEDEFDEMAIRYSHPTWVVRRWVAEFGKDNAEAVLQADNKPHPVYLHLRPGVEEKVKTDLEAQKVHIDPVAWPPRTYSLKSHEGGLFTGESFKSGDWMVQDWVPQAMLEMLPLSEGQRAWDVCAAPGGKTVGLAWKLGEKGQVLATDSSADRRKRLVENIDRTGLKNVQVHDGELKKLPPSQKFDLVWVDAPCSGTGVMGRRADLRWKVSPKDVKDHVALQRELLEDSFEHIYPKGYLVYSTCSLEKEENQEVIEGFLKTHSEWQLVNLPLPEGHIEITQNDKGVMFLPTADHDGGFLAVLQRG
jgi:16S rRNA (cytosine967-C5)-methyltransferase